MGTALTTYLSVFLKLGAFAVIFNEIRGLILAAPVLYGIYEAGGTLMAIWIGVCSLGGIALSVIVPWFAAKKIQRYAEKRWGPQGEPVPAAA